MHSLSLYFLQCYRRKQLPFFTPSPFFPSQIKEIILISRCVFYFCDYDFESFLTLENMWSQEVSAYAYFTVYPVLPKSVWKQYNLIYDPQPPEIRRSPKAPPSGELLPPQGGD